MKSQHHIRHRHASSAGAVAVFLLLLLLAAAPLSAQEDWYMSKPIAGFTFIGLDTVSENELQPLVRSYVGTVFTLKVFWEIQEILYALDYFESIEANARAGDAAQSSVIIEFTVREKPTVAEILVNGNRRLRRGEILGTVLIKKGDMVTDTQANLDAQAIMDLYREKGYADASVKASLEPGDEENTVIVKFTVDEGAQTSIKTIMFSGNSFASESTLRKKMKTKPQSLFSSGVFQELKFEEDLQNILDYYGEHGYVDVKIEKVDRSVERDEEQGKNLLNITVYIKEGQQWTYGGMEFEGNAIFSDEELFQRVRQSPGKNLDRTKLEADTLRVIDLYYENGYIFNIINRRERRDEKTQEIFYTIQIVEKDRAHIENIILKGNDKTKDYVILRELPFEEGDIFSKANVLLGLRNLYNLQYFNAIQTETPLGSADGLMDLVLNVEEGNTANINFGVMFGGGDYPIQGLLKWQENNFLGRGLKIGVNAELSTLRQLISLSFEEPWLLGKRWLGGVSFSFEHAVVPNVLQDNIWPIFGKDDANAVPDPYRGILVDPDDGTPSTDADAITDYEYELRQGERIPEQYLMDYTIWKFSLGLTTGYRHFTPVGWLGVRSGLSFSLEQIVYEEDFYRPFDYILRESNSVWKNVNKLGVTLFWDKRDFFLNPAKGFYIAQGVTFALGIPKETREYIRTDSTVEGFLTLVDTPASDNWDFKLVLAAHSGLSLIHRYPWRDEAIAITNDLLYIDGWNIARGWPLERDLKAVWDNRLELRLPISQQLLWWTFFFDGVAGFPEISDMRGMSLDNFYFSFGGGLRFTIPQFPIRLYLAKRFKRTDGDWSWVDGNLPFFGTTVDFVISLGGDTF